MASDGWRYCRTHGRYYDPGDDGCRRCQVAEESAQELLRSSEEAAAESSAAAAAAMRESDFRRANPGEYECPHCLYRTLRSGATRCPMCHGQVDAEYWREVRTREQAEVARQKALAEAAAEEARRTAPAREAAARAEHAARERAAVEAAARAKQRAAQKVFWGLMIPVSWFVGGYAGWAAAHLWFDSGILKVLLGLVFAGVGAIVAQGVPYYLMDKS